MPLLLPKESFGRGIAAPLPNSTLNPNHWGGRGAGTPAPQLPLVPEKFGASKFCRFKEQKKETKGRKVLLFTLYPNILKFQI